MLVDVDADTWTLDPQRVRDAITPRTRAIIPVHLYGNLCCMDDLLEICKERGIAIVEDATEALGGTWRGRPAGTMGEFGCFSFNGNKLITTGGGGMVTARDPERRRGQHLVNQVRRLQGYYHPEWDTTPHDQPEAASATQMDAEGFLKRSGPSPGSQRCPRRHPRRRHARRRTARSAVVSLSHRRAHPIRSFRRP